MFGWFKKNDGFEWHKYVRTTIAVRRHARRQKAEELKHQAADRIKAARSAAGDAAICGAKGLGAASRVAVERGASGLETAFALAGAGARYGSAAALAGGHRILGAAARLTPSLTGLVPAKLWGRTGVAAGGCAVAVACVYAMSPIMGGRGLPFPSLPFFAKTVEGKAVVTGPGLVKIGDATIRLTGIEAPDRDQVCTRPQNRRWRCGEAAISALVRLTAGKQIVCSVHGPDTAGLHAGTCRDKETDIAAALVKAGHVFAGTGIASSFGSLETEARAAKAGIWSGEAERPDAWRSRMWSEASKRTPTGCPIKGQVAGSAKTYVLPWHAQYDRTSVNTRRGGRWFCTEQEAIDAGWKPSAKG